MITQRLSAEEIASAAAIIKRGGLLGIPTETVYGLGANGLDPEAVAHIFEAKGRPQDNPLILHIPSADWLERYCQAVPESAYRLAERFWPGPMTMVLRRKAVVPDVVTAGLDTVGMRCPAHPVCRAILAAADVPVAAPSGNTSGRPSPTNMADMLEDMDGKIDGIVDGGSCTVGVESTIIDLTVTPPRLLRPGGITLEQLRSVLGEVAVDDAVLRPMGKDEHPRAPGMKYRHYAPKAPVTVVRGEAAEAARTIRRRIGDRDGVICFNEFRPLFEGHPTQCIGPASDPEEQARRVFDALRAFDHTDVAAIWAMCPDGSGIGLAVCNRLNKAAGFHIIEADGGTAEQD
ncbi:L-threonylcarbamoyladenylate synthase [Pseudoflavonifractor sp. HCP28S3_F10]|uniref:L-threonylcarbamoyladenylate synthase n=1 Tax=Pseudoflavonifractor sp. HCP28S3_F10 TaxID=3438947 RepID=UPI003F89C826